MAFSYFFTCSEKSLPRSLAMIIARSSYQLLTRQGFDGNRLCWWYLFCVACVTFRLFTSLQCWGTILLLVESLRCLELYYIWLPFSCQDFVKSFQILFMLRVTLAMDFSSNFSRYFIMKFYIINILSYF